VKGVVIIHPNVKKPTGRPKSANKMSRIYGVRLPVGLENGLQAYCTTNGINASEAIRKAVKTMLKEQFEDKKKE